MGGKAGDRERAKVVREFWLSEIKQEKVALLREMVAAQGKVPGRRIDVEPGNFNESIHNILDRCRIRESTASFSARSTHV